MKKLTTSDVISYAIKYVENEINKYEDISNKWFHGPSCDFHFIASVRDELNLYKFHLQNLKALQADCLKRGV